MIKQQRFGVEIELTGATRTKVAKAVAKLFGTTAKYVGTVYETWEIRDSENRKWKIMRDASVYPQRKKGESIIDASDLYKVEMVTPILEYKDIELLQEVVRTMRATGAFTNKSCGIHIHVDGANHSLKSLRNLLNLAGSREDMIFEALNVSGQRASRWTKKIRPEVIEGAKKAKTIEDLKTIWYEGNTYEANRHYSSYRYYGLNLHSFWQKGTVEFRMFESSLHAGKVKCYLQLCLAMSAKCIEAKTVSSKKPQSQDNDLNHNFRSWMFNLGLKGEEFKTCRLHLLANLA